MSQKSTSSDAAKRDTMQIIMRPTSELTPYDKNARTHSDAQIDQIVASIKEFGFTNPILLDRNGRVAAGHGRLAAAKKLGMDSVPCIELAGLTERQIRAYILADNKLAQNAGWDEELLKLELTDLKLDGFDVSLLGWSPVELDQIWAPETDASAEWQGMPEFEQGNKMAWRSIIVHFNGPEDLEAFQKLVGQRMTEKTKFIWYPQAEKADVAGKRYVSAE